MTVLSQIFLRSLLAAALLTASAAAVAAAPAIGLVGGKTLVAFDTETLAVSGTVAVTGVDGLAGIDVRPADKKLYGVSSAGEIVTIDPASGAATVTFALSEKLPSFEGAIVDFNPMADRLRLMGADGTNFRVNPDDGVVTVDGKLAYEDADMHAGETPAIVAAAYTNSVGKPEATKMFDIDATIVALIQQTKPNDGTLAAIGKLGIEGGTSYAFDIAATADLVNTAYLAVDNTLYTVDLETGAATSVGAIEGVEGSLSDIAILQ
ncbi:hypothetical protein GCM10007913_07940 [Devosia yakushimensis]|uniref:DUF4394 domain-containing protein n=1 Tax=Devosia yakushimensis TaxID=470028 RepID=A0ABQ5UC25_9HYPH|nr:DUF4394 domain-containing protein [Devosia yakushimensis]GLQ08862.1 hypothetical protein GCM10007913_07940 [Devosia yakushimensis]